jgi:glycosyltransferase involved in cell wall biosynthesis
MHDLGQQNLLGDFFICASERQRDWWLGVLEASGRVNPYTFGEDPSLRRLIDVVPFGLAEERPRGSAGVLEKIWPHIAPEDRVILWGGGLWPWLDPLTAVRAVARVWEERQDVRLIFPGTKHPNPWMEGIPTHNEATRRTAQELDLVDKGVFFGDWVPYEEWPDVLLESDVALTLHYDTLETRLAFRSRVLDYIWAGLPIVATRGDATSDLVEEHGLGAIVDFEDVDGVADAILDLLESPREALGEQFAEAQDALTWERAAQPLVAFCQRPRRAPDKLAMGDDLGDPFYVEERRRLMEERDRWRRLARGYEKGRFIRAMRWLDRVSRRLRRG